MIKKNSRAERVVTIFMLKRIPSWEYGWIPIHDLILKSYGIPAVSRITILLYDRNILLKVKVHSYQSENQLRKDSFQSPFFFKVIFFCILWTVCLQLFMIFDAHVPVSEMFK